MNAPPLVSDSASFEDRGWLAMLPLFFTVYLWRTIGVLTAMVVSSFAESLGILAMLPLLQIILDTGTGETSVIRDVITTAFGSVGLTVSIGSLLAAITILMTLKAGFRLYYIRYIGYTAAGFATEMRQALLSALTRARWSFFATYPIGLSANAVSSEAERASSTYVSFCNLAAFAINGALLFGSTFLIDWRISLVAGALGLVMLFGLRRFVGMTRQAGQRITQLSRSILTRLTDGLQGIKPLKAMGQEARMAAFLERQILDLNFAVRRAALADGLVTASQELLIVLMLAAGAYVGLVVYQLDLTGLLVMAVLFQRAMGALGQVQKQYQALSRNSSALWALRGMIADTEAVAERDDAAGIAPPAFVDALRFDKVNFTYGDLPVLNGVNLEIPAGKVTAVIGPSGAGKTTLVDLVCRLHTPTAGHITVDGVDLQSVGAHAWRHVIGYVPQEMTFFHDSVLRNLTLGDETISRDTIERCLRQAGAWSFVDELPDGVDTFVGERGTRFSGGQRQRLAIARALARQPRLLILDEATTALDPQTEAAICDTLRDLAGTVTILAISHQPAILRIADQVYEIDHGKVQHSQQTLSITVA